MVPTPPAQTQGNAACFVPGHAVSAIDWRILAVHCLIFAKISELFLELVGVHRQYRVALDHSSAGDLVHC
jgi:hypothetical protein